MPFKRLFKDKYAGSSPENASVVRTLFDLFLRNHAKTVISKEQRAGYIEYNIFDCPMTKFEKQNH